MEKEYIDIIMEMFSKAYLRKALDMEREYLLEQMVGSRRDNGSTINLRYEFILFYLIVILYCLK
jgi:hypothetical protein